MTSQENGSRKEKEGHKGTKFPSSTVWQQKIRPKNEQFGGECVTHECN